MIIEPSRDAVLAGLRGGQNQLIYTRLVADLDTPVSLMLKLAGAGRMTFMLESVTGGEVRGRYSVIGMKPDVIWRCNGSAAEINRQARIFPDSFEAEAEDPLTSLRALIGECHIDLPEGLPPIVAGVFGYLGYDMIRLVEKLPAPNPDALQVPDAILFRPTVTVVLDGVKGEVIVAAPIWANAGAEPETAYAQAAERVMDAVADLDRVPATATLPANFDATDQTPVSNTGEAAYLDMVQKAKDYIHAGDIFQVVPSQRWTLPFALPPFSLYRALRRTNPSPYMFYFDYGDFQIVGASPEILVRVKDGRVTIRPIAGTRPRGATVDEDKALEADLMGDEKELAEHLMLLDLGRNDVGRVAKIGTVTPTEKFIVERYSHVMHIVSNVEGELNDDHDALSALLSGLPAGTVSGAPKVRAMEIIDELEVEKRGVYGGGVGYFSVTGEMDVCIALRTGVVKDETLFIQAGGGVVWDSDPQAEHQETVNKSKALIQAAKEAVRYVRFGRSQ